ncbi:FAD-dependent oxidoreductase [soil metagenome]
MTHPEADIPTPPGRGVAVLGGGVCGLYAGLTLARAEVPVTVLESEPIPGGLAAGHRRGANFYDLGVHMLHAFDPEIFATAAEAMGDERIAIDLDAKIRWAGHFYRYPLQFGDMIRAMPPVLLARCVAGLLVAHARTSLRPTEPKDAEEALIQLYGKPLYRFFFERFTHRYWDIHPRDLSATFIKSKMPRLTAVDAIKKMLASVGIKEKAASVESALLHETLHYSRTGAETLPRSLALAIRQAGGHILTDAAVHRIELHENAGTARVHYGDRGDSLTCTDVISTIPIPILLGALRPTPPPEVLEASTHLRYRPMAVYGLLLNCPRALDALYIYYRERIFHRVGEPKNAGLVVSPPDHTILIVEMTCEIGDDRWNGAPEVIEHLYADLEAEGICTRQQVVERHLLRSPTAYALFNRGFEPHLATVQAYLDSLPILASTGRQGGFTFPNMHSAMRMGASAAQAILAKTRRAQG